jgi:plastocyanin
MKHYLEYAVTSIVIVSAGALAACGDYGSGGSAYGGGSGSNTPTDAAAGGMGQVTVMIPPRAMNLGPAAYGANPLTIARGTTVIWMNADSEPHTATSDAGIFDSGTLGTGQMFSFTFVTAGTYSYHCTIHGAASMSGTVQVNP